MAIDFEKSINETLSLYASDITDLVKQEVADVTSEGLKDLKNNSPIKTGDYKKGWRKKKLKSTLYGDEWVLYNKTDYRLTHLLEDGHDLKRGGAVIGHVKAYPHISKTEKKVSDELVKRVEAVIRNGS